MIAISPMMVRVEHIDDYQVFRRKPPPEHSEDGQRWGVMIENRWGFDPELIGYIYAETALSAYMKAVRELPGEVVSSVQGLHEEFHRGY
jgi:hypothetical protein